MNPSNTTLTAFFNLCATDKFAKTLLYNEVPQFYTWNQSTKQFYRRKQGIKHPSVAGIFSTSALGRVYTVHPSNSECYYLRMLIHVIKGPTSFQAIKTIDSQECQTYREACFKLGMLEHDQHWNDTLTEASETCHPHQIRTLFAIILTTCAPSNPKDLWEKHKESMSEDILLRERQDNPNLDVHYGLCAKKKNGGLLFLDAPGGTGKTFLLNLILAEVRRTHEIALAVASSGIAATLLDGGRTAHSAFKLPLNLNVVESPICNIGKASGMAAVLKECQLIIWDECTMAHKKGLEALDRTLRDFRNDQRIMGGVVILLAGDFRQTLPVIQRSTPADELNACLKYSFLWKYVKKITLSTNMRLNLLNDDSARTFAKQLLDMGDGKLPVNPKSQEISFPQNFCQLQSSIEDLDNKVFPNIASNFKNHDWLSERAILAPKNDDVNKINDRIQLKIPGEAVEYKSIDTVTEENDAINYPIEFLNSLEPSGMPPHKLTLKIGSTILLLRNLNTPKLCNGTRLAIKQLLPNLIKATIIIGKFKGDVLIPRIPMIPTDLPFTFKRLQFPIRLAFAMTINKAQGQSLQVTGLNLSSPCFSHGQLYVACSRLGNPKYYVEEREDGTVLVGCSTFVKICLRSGKFHQGIGFHESISNTIGEATMQERTISFNQAFYNALMFFKEMRDHLAQEGFKKQERLKKQLKMKLEWEKKN
ncbi:ATP-dependent DNA helicase pif1-like [Cotesia typhae]|uniref:ATP-dependent DNA helicase pif1-like n=1 Tax=Cotesia typhae TaxID=2053667 RepID=UPI003D68146F